MKQTHVVITTIFVPTILNELLVNIERCGHLDDTKIWVVADKKTDISAPGYCQSLAARGLDVVYLDCETQAQFIGKLGPGAPLIPWNSLVRRNAGILFALADGAERIILLDDDNFPTETDFIGGHHFAGMVYKGDTLSQLSGWYDALGLLDLETNLPLPRVRGFPYHNRATMSDKVSYDERQCTIAVNQGLWIGSPDLDALTLMQGHCRAVGYQRVYPVVLDPHTWTPINTQNTSFACAVAPVMWSVNPDFENRLRRFDDILMGYFAQSVLQGTRYAVSVGEPVVDHRRNRHDYILDLLYEAYGIYLCEWLVPMLREQNWRSTDISERMNELADWLETLTPPPVLAGWLKQWLADTSTGLRRWTKACRILGSNE